MQGAEDAARNNLANRGAGLHHLGMLLQIALVIVMVLGVVALFWLMVQKASRRILVQYRILADRYGLELTEPPPRMFGFVRPEPFVHGRHEGRELSVSVPGKGLQNTRQIETVLKVGTRATGPQAQITGGGMLGRLQQRGGVSKTRWTSGDPAFDEATEVRTDEGARLSAVLPPERRVKVRDLLRVGKGALYLGSRNLAYAELGLVADARRRERFEAAVDLLYALAEAMERPASTGNENSNDSRSNES